MNKEQNLVSKQKLLLADDSVTIQKVVNLTFADEGIEVISVGDGDSAMEKILETAPDLIMVDVNMPGLNGYQICEKLRNNPTLMHTPVILLVGSFEPFDEEEAKRVGADDYLTKPFQSIRQLVQKVTTLLNAEKTNGYVAAVEPEIKFENTPEILPSAADNFADTLKDYSTQAEKNEFGDVTDDDEMIQTSRFPAFTTEEVPRFEAEKATEIDIVNDENSREVQYLTDELEESKPYIPTEHETEEPTPYVPVETYTEIEEPKPYVPIEHEIEEPKPYIPVEHSMEIVGSNPDYETLTADKYEESAPLESDDIINEAVENTVEPNDISLPEPSSILTLDEQNLLEITPREEDFILNMNHEQNSAADWDLIETPDFTKSQSRIVAETPDSDDSKHFAIVSPPEEESLEIKNGESEGADLSAIELETIQETESVEPDEFVEEPQKEEFVEVVEDSKVVESNEIVEDSEVVEPDEIVEKAEEFESNESVEKAEEPAELEVVEEPQAAVVETAKSVVSIPGFIASTVVSEVTKEKLEVSEELIEVIVNRVMERLSDNVVREIAWEIVPSHTDIIVKKMVQEKLDKD
jgi:CheY-like chemotaxis protein